MGSPVVELVESTSGVVSNAEWEACRCFSLGVVPGVYTARVLKSEGGVCKARLVISIDAYDPSVGVTGAPNGDAAADGGRRAEDGERPLAVKIGAYTLFADRTRASCVLRLTEASHKRNAVFSSRGAFVTGSGDPGNAAVSDIATAAKQHASSRSDEKTTPTLFPRGFGAKRLAGALAALEVLSRNSVRREE